MMEEDFNRLVSDDFWVLEPDEEVGPLQKESLESKLGVEWKSLIRILAIILPAIYLFRRV